MINIDYTKKEYCLVEIRHSKRLLQQKRILEQI